MNKHIRNTILIACLFVTMLFVTFSYAAFSQELMITGEAYIIPNKKLNLSEWLTSEIGNREDLANTGGAVRFIGSSPNNYIYYNSELWRIVGVFNVSTATGSAKLTKLVRASSVGQLSWNSSYYENNNNGINDFTDSALYNYLFKNFYYKSYDQWNSYQCVNGSGYRSYTCNYSGLSVNAASMVEKVYWNLGSTNPYEITSNGVATPAFLMQSENGAATPKVCLNTWPSDPRCNENITRNSSILTYIGLLYPSEIGYAVDDAGCVTKAMNGDTCYRSSWLASGGNEWTMSPAYSTRYGDTVLSQNGGVLSANICSSAYDVRPALYLKDEVMYESGTGSQADPILVTYKGAIGIESGLTNYAPQGEDVTSIGGEDDPGSGSSIPEGFSSNIPNVNITGSTLNITNNWADHYLLQFTIRNDSNTTLREWTITFVPKAGITIGTGNDSFLSSQYTYKITSDYIKITSKRPWSNDYYEIGAHQTFNTSTFINDGGLAVYGANGKTNILDIFDVRITSGCENLN